MRAGDYGWTAKALADFVGWVGAQGINRIAVWRADIYPEYCQPAGVEPWMYPVFEGSLNNSTAAATAAGSYYM